MRSALKTELGVDAKVSFSNINGRTSVSVRLAAPPSGDATEAKRKIVDVVNRNFRSKVMGVNVTF